MVTDGPLVVGPVTVVDDELLPQAAQEIATKTPRTIERTDMSFSFAVRNRKAAAARNRAKSGNSASIFRETVSRSQIAFSGRNPAARFVPATSAADGSRSGRRR